MANREFGVQIDGDRCIITAENCSPEFLQETIENAQRVGFLVEVTPQVVEAILWN